MLWAMRAFGFRNLAALGVVLLFFSCSTGTAEGPDGGGSGAPDSGSRPDAGGAGSPDSGNSSTDAGLPDGGWVQDGGWVLPSGRFFPDTNGAIAILADQFPDGMTSAQMQFVASHYVGTEKQLLPVTQALRALNSNFLVLHYHLSMWQSAPAVDFIINGTSWGNDYPTVTMNESWFWHNDAGERVASSVDGKLLMNVSVPDFQQYWASSLETQVSDGQYDAIFFDSASPALLQAECGGTASGQDQRLAGTAARDTAFTELGGATWIDAWESWMSALNGTLAGQGIPLIPNTSAFITGWDTTNYGLTAGVFSEGFAGTDFAESDWMASTNELLALSSAGKIMILQNYLSTSADVPTRLYYLGNYLLVKGHYTYLDYFAAGPLEWYPEWSVDLGEPLVPVAADVSALASAGVYRRDFANGSVLVNPSSATVSVTLGTTYQQVLPNGGGAVDTNGDLPGTLSMQPVTSLSLAPTSAAIILQ
jgi:hypothetical protein